MRLRLPELRATAFLLVGALVVHQLRYLAGYGGDSTDALAVHGHGYLGLGAPLLAIVTAAAIAHGLVRAAAGRPSESSRTTLLVVWRAATIGLVAVYCGQEFLEGMLSPHHPSGWQGVMGDGGWTAIPLSGPFAVLVVAAQRISSRIDAGAGNGRLCASAPMLRATDTISVRFADAPHLATASALGRKRAERAPPRAAR